MSNRIEVHVPDIGDFTDIPVIELAVSVGDEIAEDDTLITLESDKATLDVPSPHAGHVAEIKVSEGDLVSEGTLLIVLEAADTVTAPSPTTPTPSATTAETGPAPGSAATVPSSSVVPMSATSVAAETTPPVAVESGKLIYASPSVRRYARTLGVNIANVSGSGSKGRVTREDIEAFVKAKLTGSGQSPSGGMSGAAIAGLPEWPKVDFAKFGPVERMPLSRIAKISGPALSRNSLVIPHVTNFDKADVTELEEFRKILNGEAQPEDAKVTMPVFAVKAIVVALKSYPKFNSSLDGDELVIKNYWNIGIATDTPDGLVVPVVKNADKKGLREIAAEMGELAGAARTGKLKPTDMQGATFTISSLGGIGGTDFTPIINAPEVAILGMTRSEIRPVWDGSEFRPRLIQPMSLSWDHRVVDGVLAARFLACVARALGDFRLALV